ncbi:TolC family protein, partial [bacterium]|nr:TolC family protein [bacterium]
NLFDGGRSESDVEQAEANRDAVSARLQETRTLIELEVEREFREIANSIQRIEVTGATLESAREALRIAELGYGQGVITLIDYQDTDLGLHQAEILHIQAVYSFLIAEAKLRAAMGESF